MLNERLQILVTAEQRRRLEREARERGVSVGSLVREAIDAHYGAASVAERQAAVDAIRAMRGSPYLTPEELDEIFDSRYDEDAEEMLRGLGR